ncbi:hypothetical protein H310_06411 [Aphanomyces invadans]|uniref:Molybdate-anion transporter n=1 Tax=Aphanomyces invadans TaxID=157072 RepID=A0A024U6K4_9STRA|nr:hypothetical protein H310_06411 [Aphanomyces invadans]ETW01840.1 hypothetical protein H310_06411 [Aphanomyces invadans]|eukprot:XP_008869688.1 hypothetical protein H310_06411 [Aphanomyces invadans]
MSRWPLWSIATFGGLCAALLSLHALDASRSPSQLLRKSTPPGFSDFQKQYLCVYWIVMFADWLQGPNMYTLYQSYDMDVGALFMIGFTSSAVCSSAVGRLVDTHGRKHACVVFCLLEIVINVLEHVPNFTVLAIGRVLGGISTALLFSAFESWMVGEHRRRRFPDELLESTFALAAEGNGLVAIGAGVAAQVASDAHGDIAPFQLAIAATLVALLCIWHLWPSDTPSQSSAEPHHCATAQPSTPWTWPVLGLGLTYSLFEGAMYVFVFLWVPALQSLCDDPHQVPVGLVFASFMLCLAIGGKVVRGVPHSSLSSVFAILHGVAALCMAISAMEWGFGWTLGAFLAFEICVGMYFPVAATLRATTFPEATMSTIMTTFRLPTNAIVLVGTQMLSWPFSSSHVFLLCVVVHGIAAALSTTVNASIQHKTSRHRD